jgi:hypothetical protein
MALVATLLNEDELPGLGLAGGENGFRGRSGILGEKGKRSGESEEDTKGERASR